jgi:CheY-like chemotaxis protein
MARVLVVEDDRVFARVVATALEKAGHEVAHATDLASAEQALRSTAKFDVVLTDMQLGEAGHEGIDLLERARLTQLGARTVLMSAHASARDYQRARQLGAVRVLCKPFELGEILEAVEQAIDCDKGFHGSVHGMSLVDMLQVFHYSRKSMVVRVRSGAEEGQIHLAAGEIVHAQLGPREGVDALAAILRLPNGVVRTRGPASAARTIERPFDGLLLDVLRQIDEGRDAIADEWQLEDAPPSRVEPAAEADGTLDLRTHPPLAAPAVSSSSRPADPRAEAPWTPPDAARFERLRAILSRDLPTLLAVAVHRESGRVEVLSATPSAEDAARWSKPARALGALLSEPGTGEPRRLEVVRGGVGLSATLTPDGAWVVLFQSACPSPARANAFRGHAIRLSGNVT